MDLLGGHCRVLHDSNAYLLEINITLQIRFIYKPWKTCNPHRKGGSEDIIIEKRGKFTVFDF